MEESKRSEHYVSNQFWNRCVHMFRGAWASVLVDILHSQKPEVCSDGPLCVQFWGRKAWDQKSLLSSSLGHNLSNHSYAEFLQILLITLL